MNRHAGSRQDVFVVEPACLFAVPVNGMYGTAVQDMWDIRRNHITDGGVGGTDDLAALDHVPDCDAVLKQQSLLVRDGTGDRGIRQGSQNLPEAVLWVSIVELLFPRLDGGKSAKDEDAGLLIVDWGEFVGVGFVVGHVQSSFLGDIITVSCI